MYFVPRIFPLSLSIAFTYKICRSPINVVERLPRHLGSAHSPGSTRINDTVQYCVTAQPDRPMYLRLCSCCCRSALDELSLAFIGSGLPCQCRSPRFVFRLPGVRPFFEDTLDNKQTALILPFSVFPEPLYNHQLLLLPIAVHFKHE